MFKLYMGYLRDENKTVVKVGQTTKTCWSRCKNADYHICQAIMPIMGYGDMPRGLCDFLEAAMLFEYRNRYEPYKGCEYFEITNKSEADIEMEWKVIMCEIIEKYAPMIDKRNWVWYEGAVYPYSY